MPLLSAACALARAMCCNASARSQYLLRSALFHILDAGGLVPGCRKRTRRLVWVLQTEPKAVRWSGSHSRRLCAGPSGLERTAEGCALARLVWSAQPEAVRWSVWSGAHSRRLCAVLEHTLWVCALQTQTCAFCILGGC